MLRKLLYFIFLTAILFIYQGVIPPEIDAAEKEAETLTSAILQSVTPDQLQALRQMGIDITTVTQKEERRDQNKRFTPSYEVEAVLWSDERIKLEAKGFKIKDLIRGKQLASGERHTVYRSFEDPDGGIKVQLNEIAALYPSITSLETIGESIQGRPILAIRITEPSDDDDDNDKPRVLYLATHHAREWVATEMAMRLIKYLTANYKTDERIHDLLDDVEVWVVPVANPDGYEYTFTNYRLWRKSLTDNNGDGKITRVDGVDLNRNFDGRWGYDNEGSSPNWEASNYRGVAPASEPETKAVVDFILREQFKFMISYHTQGDLILYPEGWQNKTPSLDDPIFLNQAGNDETPAIFDSLKNIPYNPGTAADLYITNGGFIEWAYSVAKIPGYVVELTKGHGFEFPDDENMLETVFQDNLSFALRVAESADDPFEVVAPDGKSLENAYHTAIDTSLGSDQIIPVIARKDKSLALYYQINSGEKVNASFIERLGSTYNEESGVYFSRYEAVITGQGKGDIVTYHIKSGGKTYGPYTYEVASVTGNSILIIAAEDYSGDLPTYEDKSAPNFLKYYTEALKAGSYGWDLWDVDAMKKAPVYADVLSHYKAVIWYTGNDLEPTIPSYTVQRDIYLNLRDFINFKGGKLFVSGQDISYLFSKYSKEISNDFFQYYLGAYETLDGDGIDPDTELPYEVIGTDNDAIFGGLTFKIDGGSGASNQYHPDSFLPIQIFLPQFEGELAARYDQKSGALYPHTGDYFVYSDSASMVFKRLGGTFAIPETITDAELSFWVSFDIEFNWDFAFVEVSEAGTGIFTTLADENGLTVKTTGKSCEGDWVNRLHPFLANYMDKACNPEGKTGEWNAFTGNSKGWNKVRMDLSPYAGKTVEIYFSYATDWGTLGRGVFLDDITIGDLPIESFEKDLGAFLPSFVPEKIDDNNFKRISRDYFPLGSAIRTPNTLHLGFGFEAIEAEETRATVMDRIMRYFNIK